MSPLLGREAVLLGACLLACCLATLLNPYGYKVYAYVLTLSATAAGRGIEEWLPPGLGTWVGRAFALSVVAMMLLLAASRRRPTVREICLLACFLPPACGSVRMVAWWTLVAAPIAARLAAGLARRDVKEDAPAMPAARAAFAPTFAVGALVALAALSIPQLERFNPLFRGVRTPHRTEFDLQTVVGRLNGPSRVFTRLEWGEYLAWAASPQGAKVFMDGRIEIYSDEVWARYAAVTAARDDWQAILDGCGADALLLDRTYHGDLLPRVQRSPRWREAARAGPAVLFVRAPSDPTTDDLAAVLIP